MEDIEVVDGGGEVAIHIRGIQIVVSKEDARELAEKMTFLM